MQVSSEVMGSGSPDDSSAHASVNASSSSSSSSSSAAVVVSNSSASNVNASVVEPQPADRKQSAADQRRSSVRENVETRNTAGSKKPIAFEKLDAYDILAEKREAELLKPGSKN